MKIQRLSPGLDAPSPEGSSSKKAPHVLFVLDGFPKALGGGERIVLRLAALLPRFGFRASILTLSMHPESAFRPADAPCPVYLLPLTNAYGPAAWRGAVHLRRFLREQEVSIVQTFFESSDLWAGIVTRLLSSARLIWSRRDMGILRGRKHRLAYRALRLLPHAVFAVSERVARHVTETDGVPPERVYVTHNGLDLSTIPVAARTRKDGLCRILTIGNVRHVKGHDLLVRAAALVVAQYPNTRFLIAGEVLEPPYYQELQASVQKYGLQHHVLFLGKISDLPQLLCEADFFVLPSRSEGFSNALIEAMAAGLPSVATDVGGNAEAVHHQETGLLVPPEDSGALADALLRLLQDPQLADHLSVAAREKVVKFFSAEAMLLRITAIYRELLHVT